MATNKQIKAGMNDIGEWGDKSLEGAYGPDDTFTIGGDTIRPSKLPDLIGSDSGSDMGDLASTGADGDFGDLFESECYELPRVPLRSS